MSSTPYQDIKGPIKKFEHLNLINIYDGGPDESVKTLKESGSDLIPTSS
jgi:hypothetical protein